MHALGIVRQAGPLGRIVIPIELRNQLGIDADTKLEIFVDKEEEAVVLKKYERGCDFCGEMKDNIEYKDKKVCGSCIEKMYDEVVNEK